MDSGLVTGRVLKWTDDFLADPSALEGAIVYDPGVTPLYRAAFLVEHQAAAILMAEGGKNFHPLILATEAGVPAIAGIGRLNLATRVVTADSKAGLVLMGEVSTQRTSVLPATTSTEDRSDRRTSNIPVYVNVGYPSALARATVSGPTGIGLLRTEFAAARALALNLEETMADGQSLREVILKKGEADAVYAIAEDSKAAVVLRDAFYHVIYEAVRAFGGKEVFVRTLDIARRFDDPMGNRGIRRDVASDGHTLRLLAEALAGVLHECEDANVGVILPLVSHYSQIDYTQSVLERQGLTLRPTVGDAAHKTILFGWEIEQPAASLNNGIWLDAFQAAHGQPPHMIGVGTNDLTQFTIALGRDTAIQEREESTRRYLRSLYDEHDFSVVRQICEVAAECRTAGTRLFLLGQAGADEIYAPLLLALKVIPSVGVRDVAQVRQILSALLEEGPSAGIQRYVEKILESYPPESRDVVSKNLNKYFQTFLG